MYLCLTCLNVSPEQGECHGHPMIRCGTDEPARLGESPQIGLHPISKHWLIETLRLLQSGADELPKN
jgi:hypothetical protein